MNSAFNEQILADKLSKLSSTQQCIETLSHWCIYHRKNAEQVIQTWDKQFHSSQKDQKIPFLYLANDIIQNSRRNGTEFVNEFWKVLPAALKDVLENGDDHEKNMVCRLINIWEQRRVFGSHFQGLKDLMLGKEHPPVLELSKKRSRSSVKIVKRDSRSIKIKLSIGGMAEKIVSALHTVLSEHSGEDMDLNKCRTAVRHVEKLEKDVSNACMRVGDYERESLENELQEKEATLKQCVEKLKLAEANRKVLVDQLKTALQEQESELENVRTQLQLFEAVIEESANMRRRLNNEPVVEKDKSSMAEPSKPESNSPSANISKKSASAIAAEVADKLAASTHSQQIITSVLSTFAAEEAKSAGLASSTHPSTSFAEAAPSDKSAKIEKPLVVSDTTGTAFIPGRPVVLPAPHQPQAVLLQQSPLLNQQTTPQTHFNVYPSPAQQYLQPSGGIMVGLPYTYGGHTQPPVPPQPQSHVLNLGRPALLTQQQQQPMAMIQQPPPPAPSLTINQAMQINQHVPQFTLQQSVPPAYRPLQPHGVAYYRPQTQ